MFSQQQSYFFFFTWRLFCPLDSPPPHTHTLFILYIMLQSPVAPQPSASLFSAEKQTRVKKVFAQRLLFSFFAARVGRGFLFTARKEMWLCKGGNDFQTLVRCLGRNCVDLSFLCCISDMNRTEVLTLVLPLRPRGSSTFVCSWDLAIPNMSPPPPPPPPSPPAPRLVFMSMISAALSCLHASVRTC